MTDWDENVCKSTNKFRNGQVSVPKSQNIVPKINTYLPFSVFLWCATLLCVEEVGEQ